jgi:hypothetical protein
MRVPWLMLVALLACPGGARDAAAQAPAPVVETVEFVGCVHVREERLREAVSLKPGEAFTRQKLEADRRALLELGYFRSVAAAQSVADGRVRVTFRVVELPKVLHVAVRGNTRVERRAIQEVVSTQLGQVLRISQLQDDIRAIERLYRERGYAAHLAEAPLNEALRSGILRFEILEVRIGAVSFAGGTARLEEACRRVLREVPPGFYRPDEIAFDQRRLLAVRGVRSATPRVEVASPSEVRIRWHLNEAPGGGSGAPDKPAPEGHP